VSALISVYALQGTQIYTDKQIERTNVARNGNPSGIKGEYVGYMPCIGCSSRTGRRNPSSGTPSPRLILTGFTSLRYTFSLSLDPKEEIRGQAYRTQLPIVGCLSRRDSNIDKRTSYFPGEQEPRRYHGKYRASVSIVCVDHD
jgi:hypothetical protein